MNAATSSHPLDPLSAAEITEAVATLKGVRQLDDGWRFASIELVEPAKAVVATFQAGAPIQRRARIVCWSRTSGESAASQP